MPTYEWMISQISTVYFQSYQLAYDMAKKAEKCYQFETGNTDSNFIQFGYWDSLRKGLLSAEQLSVDLRRLESAYLEQNKREYEITKTISLALTDLQALINLRENGECTFTLPERLFDSDYPGHYMRRIKTVSLTIPCVTGQYTGINCTLVWVAE
jgi:Tc toxin complex TcA C-terminal TcB-binding domain